jgi:kynurenine formamidase
MRPELPVGVGQAGGSPSAEMRPIQSVRDDVPVTEYRASFDADVTFLNSGGLQAHGFRLDVPDATVSEDDLAQLFIRHLGLLMVDQVRIFDVEISAEPHKGSRGGPSDRIVARATATRLVELSHEITAGMITYPGLPGPEITPHLTREESRRHYDAGTEFAIDRITMVGNTGTYLDSPYHRYPDGSDLADLPLEAVADLPIVVVRITDSADRGVGPDVIAPLDVAGSAVLLHTGWDRNWATPDYGGAAPYLTEAAARHLASSGAGLVGIDSVNIDDTTGTSRPAHSILLAAGIPVLEHLTGLDQLPVTGSRLHAAPPRIRSFGTFPVRAYALVPDESS